MAQPRQRGWLGHAGPALLLLAVALFAHRAVLTAPFDRLPSPERQRTPRLRQLYAADQAFVVGTLARTARSFALEPSSIGDSGLCAPMRRPYTLGEHMFGEGLLGALPYLASRDPIFTYNAVVVLSAWLHSVAMYAVAFAWTGSPAAAVVAGLLYFHPYRIANPAHLFSFANGWTALALLAAQRLFSRGRWRDAALLTGVICLQLLESFYTVLALAILGGTFGLCLTLREPSRVPALLPKLALPALACGAFAWLLYGPYLEAARVWSILQDRAAPLLSASDYLPGGVASLGWTAAILASIGIADRLRVSRPIADGGRDPRWPLLVAGLTLLWCTLWPTQVPGVPRPVPSPLLLVAEWIPGLGAVRALTAMRVGVFLAASLLAAYGVVAILERLRSSARAPVTVGLALVTVAEIFHPDLARRSYRVVPAFEPYEARPLAADLALLESLPDGAVLDLPLDFRPARRIRTAPLYLLQGGYHRHPLAACYNSFLSGLQDEIQRLAAALPGENAADALAALGFTSVRVHHSLLGPSGERRWAALDASPARFERIGSTDESSLYRLRPRLPVSASFAALAPRPHDDPITIDRPRATVPFTFRARQGAVFRHPDPIEPSALLVRWLDPNGGVRATSTLRGLLPPALPPSARDQRSFSFEVPVPSGVYRLELTRSEEPDRVLATRDVTVR